MEKLVGKKLLLLLLGLLLLGVGEDFFLFLGWLLLITSSGIREFVKMVSEGEFVADV